MDDKPPPVKISVTVEMVEKHAGNMNEHYGFEGACDVLMRGLGMPKRRARSRAKVILAQKMAS